MSEFIDEELCYWAVYIEILFNIEVIPILSLKLHDIR